MNKLLVFTATWCAPCKELKKYIDMLPYSNDYKVKILDIEENEDLVSQYKVLSVPTQIYIKDDVEVFRKAGIPDKQSFYSTIKQIFEDEAKND